MIGIFVSHVQFPAGNESCSYINFDKFRKNSTNNKEENKIRNELYKCIAAHASHC